MKTDFYTKTVLTIIAGALLILVAENSSFIQKADATTVQRMVSVPINEDGSINVRLNKADEISVNVEEWNAGRLSTRIDDWNASTLEVHCDNCSN